MQGRGEGRRRGRRWMVRREGRRMAGAARRETFRSQWWWELKGVATDGDRRHISTETKICLLSF